MTHHFVQSLARSHEAADWPGWEETYRQAFPELKTIVDHREDGWHQRAGVDRLLVMNDTTVLRVDEKVRMRNARTGVVYEDIALEFVSNTNTKTKAPGWVCKPLWADLIAYAILPLGRCYLLPVRQLQRAWQLYGDEWKHEHGTIRARNKGYSTLSCAVPLHVLYSGMSAALITEFEPFDVA